MLRVIQWATGVVGLHAAAAVHAHPELELVAAYVYSDDKVGKDIGTLCGIEEIGVTTTNDVGAIKAMDADCVLYMALGELNPHGAIDDICELLESGKNVVSTAVTALIYPKSMGPEVVARLEAACAKGNSSFHATGIEPGWAAEVLPLTMSPVFRQIDSLLVQEIMDYATYNNPDVLFEIMSFGKRPEEPAIMDEPEVLKPTFAAPLMLVADGLAAVIDDFKFHRDVIVTEEGFDIVAGHIEAGTIAAQRFGYTAIIDGRPVLTVEHVTRLREDIAPDWPTGRGWKVTVEGLPSMVLESKIAKNGEDEVDQGCLATAMHAVHAVVPVCAAAAGIRNFLDLPIITGRGVLGGRLATAETAESSIEVPQEKIGGTSNDTKNRSAFDQIVATLSERVATLDSFGKKIKFHPG